MSNQQANVAIIVHHLMDAPELWTEKEDGFIGNGYYKVSLDGETYGMGAASYKATGSEADILRKAIKSWMDETGWKPSTKKIAVKKTAQAPTEGVAMAAYEQFARAVRSNYKSFQVHGDVNVFSVALQAALTSLDSVLMPLERIAGNKANAKPGGVHGA